MTARETASPAPYFGVEVTRRCNCRCPHCFTDSGGPGAHPGPETETLGRLLADLAQAGVTKIGFSGGEPLLRRDLEQVMAAGRRAGIASYGIVTNGFYASRARARSLKRVGLHTVQVSIDGVDALDHAEVRGCRKADFYRAVRALRLFREEGLRVDVATILSPRNLERAPEMALFCEGLGVRGLRYCTFVPTGRAAADDIRRRYILDPEKVDGFLRFLRQMNAQDEAPLKLFIDHGIGPWSEAGAFRWDAGREVAYVASEGDLYPCPSLIFPPFRVGNVFETPVARLLDDPAMSRVRTLPRSELGDPCCRCRNPHCSGGCRGASYATTGDVRAAPPYCHFDPSRAASR